MQQLAADQGFVTAQEVIRLIASYAIELVAGDAFFLTFSGHGGQVDDVNGDEADQQNETWVLWDRMLIDDELFNLFGQFQKGVRIIMLSDSCHSGTAAKMILNTAINQQYRTLAQSLQSGSGTFKTQDLIPGVNTPKPRPTIFGRHLKYSHWHGRQRPVRQGFAV
jgi:Caspase domain